MLGNTFTTVLNMSITASVAAGLIIFLRWIFGNKLPRIFNYALWAIVLLRLLIPFSLPSMFSIFNAIPVPGTKIAQSPQHHGMGNNVPYGAGYGSIFEEKTVSDLINNNINSSFPLATPEASVDPMQVLIFVISWIWLTGAAGLFSFSIFAYLRSSHRLKEAVLYKHNDLVSQCSQKLKLNRKVQIYTSDRVHTPVVCGLIKAHIILPLDITQGCNELELKHIITHELVHIKRFDYILKPLSMLALCVHWFNPVMWVGFILSQKDMEMACDEKVMSIFENDIRSEYAASLIKLATKQNVLLNGGLLAFGESNIKSRIKGIMNFRKTGFWLGTTTIVILIAIGVVLLTNGQSKTVNKDGTNENGINSKQITSFAWEIINRDIGNYESNPEVNIIDSKITRLELVESFDALANTPIDVYALEYRLLPKDLSKVVLAGGMQVDEDGWLKETCSMGSPLLVISRKIGSVEFIGTLWTGGVEEDGGLETSIKALMKLNNENQKKIGTNVVNQKNIDKLLSIIMSSPSFSSSTGDYIKEHQKEYDEIILMGEEALPYLVEILNAGDKGLRGNIVWQLCENIIKNLKLSEELSPETEKLIKETITSIDNWKTMMGYNLLMKDTETMPEFSKEEVAAARAVVEEYYRAVAAKDDEAILATMYPREHLTIERVKSGNVQLYGTETRTLIGIDYDSQDQMRRNYRPSNHYISDENIIVFKVSFNIKYPQKDGGPWNEGIYNNWSMILVRDDENSPWLIYDQGY